MAHNTSKLAKSLDFINRDLFEWLMHPLNNYRRYQAKYPGNYAGARYFTRLFFTALFTVIPVIPALYVLSRTATLFSEVRANPIKTFLMAAVAGGMAAGVYFVGFASLSAMVTAAVPSVLSFVATALTTVGLSLPPVAVAGIVLGAGLALAGSLLFYGAKLAAQAINSYRFDGLTSTSKHQLPVNKNPVHDHPTVQLEQIYNDYLNNQMGLKALLVAGPENQPVENILILGKTTPIVSATEVILEEGKQFLAEMEDIVKKSHNKVLTKNDYDYVFGGNGLHYSYESKVGQIQSDKLTSTQDAVNEICYTPGANSENDQGHIEATKVPNSKASS